MNWFEYVDSYCERIEPGLLSEPLNLFSNLAFILGPILIFARAKGRNIPFKKPWCIAGVLAMMVGIGSASFHSLANRWSEALDVVGILIFVAFALAAWILQVAQRSKVWLGVFYLTLVLLTLISLKALQGFPAKGSHGYVGILLGLFYLGYLDRKRQQASPYIFWASLIFPVSLCLRSIDEALCSSFPLGTHFGWHLLNGMVLSLVTLSLLESEAGKGETKVIP